MLDVGLKIMGNFLVIRQSLKRTVFMKCENVGYGYEVKEIFPSISGNCI